MVVKMTTKKTLVAQAQAPTLVSSEMLPGRPPLWVIRCAELLPSSGTITSLQAFTKADYSGHKNAHHRDRTRHTQLINTRTVLTTQALPTRCHYSGNVAVYAEATRKSL